MSALTTPETVIEFPAVPDEKSFPFPVWSGLLTKKHYCAMGGGAIFLFGYLIDRTTKEDPSTAAGKVGIVLGGQPITDSVIAKHYGITTKTVARFRDVLLAHKYIECQRTPYGYRYTVLKSKKFGIWGGKRSDETVRSGGKEIRQKCPITTPEIGQNCPERSDKTVRNKEDHAVDHAVKQQLAAKPQDLGREVWGFLGIEPCGPSRFRVLLETSWASRNGDLPSIVIGRTIDGWEAADGTLPPRCRNLFHALAELRKREAAAPPASKLPTYAQMIPTR